METTVDFLVPLPNNVRAPAPEFMAVWVEAENAQGSSQFAEGVCATCRWLARAAVHLADGSRLACGPITGKPTLAMPERIDEECFATELATGQVGRPGGLPAAYVAGVMATFNWTWRCVGPAPLEVTSQ